MNNNNVKTNKTSKQNQLPKYPQRQTVYAKRPKPKQKKNIGKKILKIAIVLVLVAAAVFAVIKLTTKAPEQYEISYGTVTMKTTSNAILIKDEVGYSYPEGITLISRVPDGTYVEAGTEIAKVRTSEFKNDWCEQLRIARRNTIDYMLKHVQKTDDVLFAALSVIDTEIERLSNEMLHVLSYQPEKYEEYSEKIEELYESKETLLLAKIGADPNISDYVKIEQSLKERINGATQSIFALRSGIISYNTDGYANVYNTGNIETITDKIFQNIIDDKYSTSIRDSRKAVDYTISDLSTCYVVMKGDLSSFRYLNKNDDVVINLNNGKDNYNSTISEITENVDSYLITIKLIGDFDYLYRTRFVDVSVDKSWKGIVIPKEHLVKNKDELGVYIFENGKQQFVPISVQAENDSVVVVDTSAPDCKIKQGVLIVKK